jgi:hypothetical protein
MPRGKRSTAVNVVAARHLVEDGNSMEEVMATMGISRPTFYRYISPRYDHFLESLPPSLPVRTALRFLPTDQQESWRCRNANPAVLGPPVRDRYGRFSSPPRSRSRSRSPSREPAVVSGIAAHMAARTAELQTDIERRVRRMSPVSRARFEQPEDGDTN